jgi:quinol monooxygenase YgiN
MAMIHVIATVEVLPGRKQDYLRYFLNVLTPLVRAEPGCLAYGPTVDVENPLPNHPSPRENIITILETWADLDALEAHRHTQHMHAYREFVKPLVRQVTLQVLRPVESA